MSVLPTTGAPSPYLPFEAFSLLGNPDVVTQIETSSDFIPQLPDVEDPIRVAVSATRDLRAEKLLPKGSISRHLQGLTDIRFQHPNIFFELEPIRKPPW